MEELKGRRHLLWILPITSILFLSHESIALNRSSYRWTKPSLITPKTTFFGEAPRVSRNEMDRPNLGDPSYPWYCLEQGNRHFLEGNFEKASAFFKEAYSVPGSTRVLSGFKLVESLEKLGRLDEALEALASMENNYLVSPREFNEARSLKTKLLDAQRHSAQEKKKPEPFTGHDWVLQLSEWRLRYVLGAMDELRTHGVPLKETAQKYVFLFDEYFLAHSAAPAGNANEALAGLVYRREPEARILVNRWRIHPETALTEEAKIAQKNPNYLTGAEWITLVHDDKMAYIIEAMEILEGQHVPMNKSLYAYVDAMDKLFTSQPELPAFDGAVALASYLYNAEPKARAVLEALRLE